MKIAVITDTHFGVRNDNKVVLSHQEKFFTDLFFPTMKERGIKHILHVGDLVDRRKYINIDTLHRMRKVFFDPILENGYETHIILGNHDIYYKGTSKVNALDELIRIESDLIHKYSDTSEVEIGGTQFLLIPWINDENFNHSIQTIKDSDADYAFGHLELYGFEMNRGTLCTHGLNRELFRSFKHVYSGHFHEMSSQGNITYLGAPYHMTWADYPSPRGFHIMDTETGEMEFVRNRDSIFIMSIYNDKVGLKPDDYAGKYVKILVEQKNDSIRFDQFVSSIEAQGPIDLRLIESFDYNHEVGDIDAQNTPEIINKSVDILDTTCDKDMLKRRLQEVYIQAMSMEKELK